MHFLNTIVADLRKEGRNNLAGEFGAEEEEQDIIYFLCTVKLVHCPTVSYFNNSSNCYLWPSVATFSLTTNAYLFSC